MSWTHSGRAVLWAVSGTILWLVCFAVMYGGLSLACASTWAGARVGPASAVTVVVMALWLAHAVVLAIMIRAAWRNVRSVDVHPDASPHDTGAGLTPPESSRFMAKLTLFLHVGSAAALVVLALPVVVLAPCL